MHLVLQVHVTTMDVILYSQFNTACFANIIFQYIDTLITQCSIIKQKNNLLSLRLKD